MPKYVSSIIVSSMFNDCLRAAEKIILRLTQRMTFKSLLKL